MTSGPKKAGCLCLPPLVSAIREVTQEGRVRGIVVRSSPQLKRSWVVVTDRDIVRHMMKEVK